MKELIKTVAVMALRLGMRLFHLIPIRENRVFFSAYSGHQYTCNPKYISEYLQKQYGDRLELIWCYCNSIPESPDGIRFVRYGSFAYYRCLLTSKAVIFNDLQNCSYLPFRKKQTVIQTWHGSGLYKKVGRDVPGNTVWNNLRLSWTTKHITYFLAGATAFTNTVIRGAFGYKGEVKEVGLPRNDILLHKETRDEMREKVREALGIPDDCFAVLYAPTFRGAGDHSQEELELKQIQAAFTERFGKECLFLVRSHHAVTDRNSRLPAGTTNVTDYPDMQELLCAADAMISDYSSCIWDFSLTGKPCFIFAADLSAYRVDRDFYTDIFRWPFPLALSNDELVDAIRQFDENDYLKRLNEHFNELGCCESGEAAKRIGDDIAKRCGL